MCCRLSYVGFVSRRFKSESKDVRKQGRPTATTRPVLSRKAYPLGMFHHGQSTTIARYLLSHACEPSLQIRTDTVLPTGCHVENRLPPRIACFANRVQKRFNFSLLTVTGIASTYRKRNPYHLAIREFCIRAPPRWHQIRGTNLVFTT